MREYTKMSPKELDSIINAKYLENLKHNRMFNYGDVDNISVNHKSPQYQTNLSIVEEGDNPESPTGEKDKFLPSLNNNNNSNHNNHHQKSKVDHTPNSSIEDVTTITNGRSRNRTHLTPDGGSHHDAESNSDGRRPSIILQYLRRPSVMASIRRSSILSPFRSEPKDPNDPANRPEAIEQRLKNRRIGNDALSTALSALYAKIVVIIGIALPITEILSNRISAEVYLGFYVYLYFMSIIFVIFIYGAQFKNRPPAALVKDRDGWHRPERKRATQFGSFYLRVGAIAFGIGNMVYSGLELGQFFELQSGDESGCGNIFVLLQPLLRMVLTIVQIQFIFLNTNDLDMGSHKVISRFGLMHMVATNLCEWLYTLVEETKHEIWHLAHSHHEEHNGSDHSHENITEILNGNHTLSNTTEHVHQLVRRSATGLSQHYQDCQRSNIMGSLVQNAAPFLFPCTIEYSLICAVILYEMWKKVKSIPEINKARKNSMKNSTHGHGHEGKGTPYHFSIDCSKAQRGMFAGIVVIVLTIISLIMYFVLHDTKEYLQMAIMEVTYYEILLYTITAIAVLFAFNRVKDLKFHKPAANDHHAESVKLDCTLLVLAGLGVYVYGMFSILGSVFAVQDGLPGAREGLAAEVLSLIQVSLQTLFVLNACWRRCKGTKQNREKPGRQIVTFLLVANISMWFINTLIKGHASFRPHHLEFFGTWAWVIITHVSMPLAIFYRYHSTICLFDVWKSAYKMKVDHH